MLALVLFISLIPHRNCDGSKTKVALSSKNCMGRSEKPSGWDYVLILLIFAITGTTASLLPKYIMPFTGLEKGSLGYVLAYILLITPIYQVLLLGYAFLFGKYAYFVDKQKRLGRWIMNLFRRKPSSHEEEHPIS